MGMNKQSGNMYPWVTHTWNTVKGKCPHDCDYCYMKVYPLNDVRFDESELKTDLGNNNIIFVGSSCDMWAEKIPNDWIERTLYCCSKFDNIYLFQSKNPMRFKPHFVLPGKHILGTTIETNRDYHYSLAPLVESRIIWMRHYDGRKMISIEPILDFDVSIMTVWIEQIQPEFVSIGADSKGHNLPEPNKEKILELIDNLKQITEVKIKNNLNRIIN